MKSQIDIIKHKVCEYYGVTFEEIAGTTKPGNIVRARHVFCYLAYKLTKQTFAQIGKLINRDHATVLFGKNKVAFEVEMYQTSREEIEKIIYEIENENPLVVVNFDLLELTKYYSQTIF